MLRCSLFLYVFCEIFVKGLVIVEPGPRFPPTKGEVWPKPQQKSIEEIYFKLNLSEFHFQVTDKSCPILTRAINRYGFVLRDMHRTVRRLGKRRRKHRDLTNNADKFMKELQVQLTLPCEELPYYGMVESYNLTVASTSLLQSTSLWGILRGLETWAQLFYFSNDYSEVRINKTDIVDFPRYAHRGLLLDTSRHYISMTNILKTLDAMSMNKMNVFHWHIVDDQSFPYKSEKFPDLSRLGAYHISMVYSKDDITKVVKYATDRGIRVLPEFDVPGHTRSWGVGYPDLLTKCYENGNVVGLGPMDPTNNNTYVVLRELIQEIQTRFPEKYFHVGGDEVDLNCWASNPEIQNYMMRNNIKTAEQLHALFMRNAIPLLGDKLTPIVWQEVFDENVPLPNNTIVQVWKSNWIFEMIRVLKAGHQLIFSSAWYLDHLKTGGDWDEFYSSDPRKQVTSWQNDIDVNNIVGGEACMWSEVVDNSNVISRVWPRASAVAEKLWGDGLPTHPDEFVYRRLEEHTCRMNRRGIHAQPPSGPGFCLGVVQ